ncbi:MAG: hypothetical protein GXO49_04200 [Chlorobi bacterium]|nr:hypothetical protein [Chlorobiota bacterium]
MKNRVFLILFLSTFFFSSFAYYPKTIDADLISIKYFSVNKCNNKNNVYAVVTYKVNYKDIFSLKMINKYPNGISTSSPVNETDKKGYVIYSFCTEKNKKTSFKTCFISKNGEESKIIDVIINPSSSEIITGTAPQTIIKN